MPRYKRIRYGTIAKMCIKVAEMYGQAMPLREMIDSMQHSMQLCIDPARVKEHLGDRCKEVRVQDGDVLRVRDMVVP